MSQIIKIIRGETLSTFRNLLAWNSTTRVLSRDYIPRVSQNRSFQTTNSLLNEKPKTDEKKKDDIPIINFKTYDVKKIFKQFYSVYGPLFVGCHISISLTSLGFFSTLVWMNVDLVRFIPEFFQSAIGEEYTSMTGSGGKFVLAYAIHKSILPFRLAGAIWLTRFLSAKINYLKRVKK